MLLGGAALEDGNFFAGGELVEVVGVAAGLDVKIGFVACRALRLDGGILVLLEQLLKTLVDVAANEVTLLDPAFGATGSTHPHEAALAFQYVNRLSVFCGAGFVVDGGDAIAQVDLGSRNVIHFQHTTAAPATRQQHCRQEDGHQGTGWTRWKKRFHGMNNNIARETGHCGFEITDGSQEINDNGSG